MTRGPLATVLDPADDSPWFVDTHAHLDEPAFDRDREAVIAAAHAVGVARIVNVGYRPLRWATTVALTLANAGVDHMLGLHPQHAAEMTGGLLNDLADQLRASRAVAVGEIGFDLYRDGPPSSVQESAFIVQLELATELGLPVVIHQRWAEEPLMMVLARFPDLPRVVLHSFDGTARLADFARERGCFFGVGGLMTRSHSEAIRTIIAGLPLDRLLLETDAPYLTPAGVKDRRNVPANIPIIAARLADVLGVSTVEVARRTAHNAATALAVPVGAPS